MTADAMPKTVFTPTPAEHEKILRNYSLWLDGGASELRANLRGADLWGADLQGADLQEADLEGANLRGADLEGTIF